MKWIKRLFVFLLVIITVGLIHYYLPQRDIVEVVGTDVKRMDICLLYTSPSPRD